MREGSCTSTLDTRIKYTKSDMGQFITEQEFPRVDIEEHLEAANNRERIGD
jgi:hypothetical protein